MCWRNRQFAFSTDTWWYRVVHRFDSAAIVRCVCSGVCHENTTLSYLPKHLCVCPAVFQERLVRKSLHENVALEKQKTVKILLRDDSYSTVSVYALITSVPCSTVIFSNLGGGSVLNYSRTGNFNGRYEDIVFSKVPDVIVRSCLLISVHLQICISFWTHRVHEFVVVTNWSFRLRSVKLLTTWRTC